MKHPLVVLLGCIGLVASASAQGELKGGARVSIGYCSAVGSGHAIEAHGRLGSLLAGIAYSRFTEFEFHGVAEGLLQSISLRAGYQFTGDNGALRLMTGLAHVRAIPSMNNGSRSIPHEINGLGVPVDLQAVWLPESNVGFSFGVGSLFVAAAAPIHLTAGIEFGFLR